MFKKTTSFLLLLLGSVSAQADVTEVGLTPGEFRVDESGAATYNIPLNLPAGRAGVKPQLGLAYSSNNVMDGPLGVGWSLTGMSSISRCPMTPIHDDGDIREITFQDGTDEDGRGLDKYCLDGQRLFLVDDVESNYGKAGTRYRTEIDNFSIITAHGQASTTGPLYFTVENKAGETHYYGDVSAVSGLSNALTNEGLSNTDAFVEPGGYEAGSVAKIWAVKAIKDVKDNFIVYNYNKSFNSDNLNEGRFSLSSIKYTGNFTTDDETFASIDINYRPHKKPTNGFMHGSYIYRDELVRNITVSVDGEVFRTYVPDYEDSSLIEERTLMISLQECVRGNECLEPTTFDWQRPELGVRTKSYKTLNLVTNTVEDAGSNDSTQVFDINGDGFQDLIYTKDDRWRLRLGEAGRFGPTQDMSTKGAKKPKNALSIDYNGDGVRDLLVANSETENWYALSFVPSTIERTNCRIGNAFCINTSVDIEYTEQDLGIVATGWKGEAQVMDVNGDGFEDIVFRNGKEIKAYLNNGSAVGNDSFDSPIVLYTFDDTVDTTSFNENVHMQNASMKSASGLDFNGDGRTDLILQVSTITDECDEDDGSVFTECQQQQSYKSRTTEYKLFKSAGPVDAPILELHQTIGDAAKIDTLRVADLNGDGLSDLVYVNFLNEWFYSLSNGIRYYVGIASGLETDDTKKLLTQFIDLNNDGRADVLNATSNSEWDIFFSKPDADNHFKTSFEQRGTKSFTENGAARFGDVTGDGKVDLLLGNNGTWEVYTDYNRKKNFVIDTITNSHGINTNITYLPMTNKGVYLFKAADNLIDSNTFSPMSGMHLVSRVSTLSSDNVSSRTVTRREFDKELGVIVSYTTTVTSPAMLSVNYQYGGLLVHKQGRGDLGFQMLKTLDAQTGVETETQYNQDYGLTSFAKARMPIKTQQRIGNQLLSTAENELRVKTTDEGSLFPYIYESTENSYVYGTDNTSVQVSSTLTTNNYDGRGNLTSSSVVITDAATSQTLTTKTTNGYGNVEQQRLGRLLETTVTKSRTGQTPISRVSQFTYEDGGLGLLKSSTVAPGEDNELVTSYEYDAYGNKTSVSVTGNQHEKSNKQTRTTTTKYGDRGRFVDTVTNSLGHKVTYSYDGVSANSASGVINQVKKTDANGQHSTSHMNDFGRTTHTTSSVSDAVKYVESWFCTDSRADCSGVDYPYYVTIEKETSSSSTAISPEKQAVYDRFGRVLLTRVKNLDGTWVTQKTEYDYRGRQYRVYEPGSNIYYTETHYLDDGIGLVEKTTSHAMYDTTEIIHEVNGLTQTTTEVVDPFVGITPATKEEMTRVNKVFTNAFGETTKTQDAEGNTVEFVYDAYGNLKSSTTSVTDDVRTNFVSTVYDDYGRKLETSDPIKGTWEYTYNAFGEIYTQKNAKGEMFEFYYDVLGRKIKSYNPGEGTLCWYYDGTVAEQAVGKLIATAKFGRGLQNSCSSFSASGTSIAKEYTYNTRGLRDTVTTTISSEEYIQSQTYDSYARPLTTTYPNKNEQGYSITNVYEDGFLTAIQDAQGDDLKTFDSMTIRGQLEKVTYGNGYEVTNTYRADNGWLESRLTKDNSGTFQQQMYLTYYGNGNVYTRQNVYGATIGTSGTVHDYMESYSYDKLNRLTVREIETYTGQSYTTKFEENQSFVYDGWGNITFKTGVGYYKYSQSEVHRLLGVYSDENHTQGNEKYDFNHRYDTNGNILSDGKRNFEYSSFDKVERITNNDGSASSVMHYGVDRQMYYKDDCFTTRGGTVRTQTTYLGSFEKVERSNSSGEPDTNFTEYKYYVGGDIVITQRKDKGDTTHYLHKDNLGSVVAVSDQVGEIVTQAIYDPWGERSEIYTETAFSVLQVAAVTDRGFTGHKHIEALDIIHMKGRIYDSMLGRFIQADPFIQAQLNSQSYNRYSYVMNNPMGYTDPSGYLFSGVKKRFRKSIRSLSKVFGKELVNLAGTVASYWCGPAAAACSAAWTYEFNRAHGASSSGALKAAAISGATTYAFQQIGDYYSNASSQNTLQAQGTANLVESVYGAAAGQASYKASMDALINFGGNYLTSGQVAGQIFSHAIVGGVAADLSGGKFGHGFFAAGITKGVGTSLNTHHNNGVMSGTIINIVVGGTASVVSGGKFANGAISGAYQSLFNAYSKVLATGEATLANTGYGAASVGTLSVDLSIPIYDSNYNLWGFYDVNMSAVMFGMDWSPAAVSATTFPFTIQIPSISVTSQVYSMFDNKAATTDGLSASFGIGLSYGDFSLGGHDAIGSITPITGIDLGWYAGRGAINVNKVSFRPYAF